MGKQGSRSIGKPRSRMAMLIRSTPIFSPSDLILRKEPVCFGLAWRPAPVCPDKFPSNSSKAPSTCLLVCLSANSWRRDQELSKASSVGVGLKAELRWTPGWALRLLLLLPSPLLHGLELAHPLLHCGAGSKVTAVLLGPSLL